PLEYWELGFQLAIGFSPYDIVYDAASLLAGKDIITGDELTDFDKFAMALGVFTVIGDDLLKLGKKISQLDTIKKAGNVTSALDTGRKLFSDVKNTLKNFRAKGLRGGLADLSARLGRKMKGFFGDGFGKLPEPPRAPRKSRITNNLSDEAESAAKKFGVSRADIERVAQEGERALAKYED
ncbi:MAG: hypothetical protein GY796_32025, partial [Chloroflexi bacterium]|nr:hypothetical protein [Chloroflexota bacterium]